ncbi:hypothetical protein [Bacillus thuringiensis]|nr:hypothetical protein [Bacillus thuringiensis]
MIRTIAFYNDNLYNIIKILRFIDEAAALQWFAKLLRFLLLLLSGKSHS